MKKKKIFALGLSLISLLSVAFTGCSLESVLPENNNDVVVEKPIANVINSIKCSFSPTVTTYSTGEQTYIAKTITASVLPENATNKEIDYSVSWRAGSERINEDVHDYVDVVQDSDGSLSATVYCYKPFGDDKILITATARDGGAKGLCTVTYIGIASEMDVTSSLTLSHNEERGDYYELATNQTYDFNVELSNIFGATSTSNLTYDVKGYGSFYVGWPLVYIPLAKSDTSIFYQVELKDSSPLEKYFNVEVQNNVLTVSTNDNGFAGMSYVDWFERNPLGGGAWSDDAYRVIPAYDSAIVEEFAQRVGLSLQTGEWFNAIGGSGYSFHSRWGKPSLNDDYGDIINPSMTLYDYFNEPGAWMIEFFPYSLAQAELLNSYYFEVTVTDNVSGMSKSFRFTICPGVSSVDIPDIVV